MDEYILVHKRDGKVQSKLFVSKKLKDKMIQALKDEIKKRREDK